MKVLILVGGATLFAAQVFLYFWISHLVLDGEPAHRAEWWQNAIVMTIALFGIVTGFITCGFTGECLIKDWEEVKKEEGTEE